MNDRRLTAYETVVPILAFIVGALFGGVQGYVLANKQLKEAMEDIQTQQIGNLGGGFQ